MQITNEIKYVGVNDHKIDLFEGQFIVPNGMSYNSYVILNDKIAVMDSVDQNFGDAVQAVLKKYWIEEEKLWQKLIIFFYN